MTTFISIAAILIALYLIVRYSNGNKEDNVSKGKFNNSNAQIDALLRRANEKSITKDFKSAVAITDKVLLLQPDNYDALVCRATGLEALNFNLDAIDDYERALKIDNSDANTYGLLGLTYRKIGDIENGQKCLKVSVEKGMKLYEMNYNILLDASDIMKQVFSERGSVPENLLRRNPNEFVDNLSHVDKEEFRKAVKNNLHSLETAIALDPDNKYLKDLYEFAKKQAE